MKNILSIALVIFALSACSKSTKNASVVKDCTGSYIRIVIVCNESILVDYKENDVINVTFAEVQNCPELDGKVVCELYHQYKSIVKIQSIN